VISPKNEKSVRAKIMGEAGVSSKAVVETEINRTICTLSAGKSYSVDTFCWREGITVEFALA
jgi:hypothetical protein